MEKLDKYQQYLLIHVGLQLHYFSKFIKQKIDIGYHSRPVRFDILSRAISFRIIHIDSHLRPESWKLHRLNSHKGLIYILSWSSSRYKNYITGLALDFGH